MTHLGTLRVFDGKPPCTVKLILEGMEETESNLEAFVEAHPELFACDLFIICDMGNLRVGEPVLTTALRGDVACVVTVRTLEHPLALRRVRRPGARRDDGARAAAGDAARRRRERGRRGCLDRPRGPAPTSARRTSAPAPTCSTASRSPAAVAVGDRLWAHPSINAIGIDMTNIAGSSNVLIPEARAKISMRIVPGSEPVKELDALVAHLETHAPWGAQVEVQRTKEAPPFRCETDGPGYAAARWALEEAFGKPAGEAGSRRLDPAAAHPAAGRAQTPSSSSGAPRTSPLSRIHASDESVDPAEIERLVVAQALLLQRLADGADRLSPHPELI